MIFLIGLIAAEVIRFPHRMRVKQARRQKKTTDDRTRPIDLALDLAAFSGMEIIPLIYIFSGWPQFADYARPELLGWLGAIGFAGCLYVLYRAHVDLGQNWSPTVEVTPTQSLVTSGIYGVIRHPIYAARRPRPIAPPKARGRARGTAIRVCIAARRWLTSITSTAWTKTLGRSLSNSVRTPLHRQILPQRA